ncbi:hypothetical protein [Terrisporobacter sp.]|uniref:hypothetical protein n=1 Tax=Terrisporobacter sp. TaxID=1965305 RepID=UPI00262C142F|nr:hypothetical protein [Terrisporobacter sp.]
MFYLNDCGNWCNKLEDLRGNISDNTYEFIEYLIKDAENKATDSVVNIEEEMEVYEKQVQDYRYLLADTITGINELKKLMDQKRWNKQKMVDTVNSVKSMLLTEDIDETRELIKNTESNFKYMLSLEDKIKDMNKEIKRLEKCNSDLRKQIQYKDSYDPESDYDDEIPF